MRPGWIPVNAWLAIEAGQLMAGDAIAFSNAEDDVWCVQSFERGDAWTEVLFVKALTFPGMHAGEHFRGEYLNDYVFRAACPPELLA